LDECKDANEYLQKHGKAELLEAAKVFIPFPVEGSFTIANIQDEILDMYQNGLEPPTKVGLGDFDNLIGLTPGYILTVTGIPGHGKSEFVDELTARLILKHGWRCGAHSPENKPTRLHVSKLIRKVVGRGWMGQDKMSATDVHRAMNMLNEKMWWIKSQKEFSVDKLLSAVDELIQSYGIKFFIIDAWNTLYHEDGSDQYISRQLQKISTFCETKGVLAVIVAHPFKMQKEKDSDEYRTVTPYDIKGASEWYDKSDIILTVQRNFTTNNTRVHVWKVKFSHWGKVGSCDFAYDPPSGRYINPLVPNSSQLHSWLDPDVQLELPVVEVTNEQPKPIAANNFFIEPVDRVETIHEQYETPKYNETTDTFDNAPF
jgi:twinkle protein